MNLFTYKTKKVLRFRYRVVLLASVFLLLLVFAKPIMIAVADYLHVPSSTEHCDVLIVQAGSSIGDYVMREALKVYERGQVDRLIVVLHAFDLEPAIFAIPNYRRLVIQALDSLNVPKRDYEVLFIPLDDPYTYNSALALADTLQDVHSILLFNDNFHIRRSYLTYKKVFEKHNITVRPYAMPIYLNSRNWWRSANGWRRVVDEYIKLTFYWINGYI